MNPLPTLPQRRAALKTRHGMMNHRPAGSIAGEQHARRHLVHGDQVEPRLGIAHRRPHVARPQEDHERGEAGGTVDPPGERVAPARGDDAGAHDRQRQGSAPGRQQVLRQGLRQRIRVGVARSGEELGLVGGSGQDRAVQLLRRGGQRGQRLDDRGLIARVGSDERGRDADQLLEPGARARQVQQVEARCDVLPGGVGEWQAELHRGRGVHHVRGPRPDLVAHGWVQGEARLVQRAFDDPHPTRPVGGEAGVARGGDDLLPKPLFRGARALGRIKMLTPPPPSSARRRTSSSSSTLPRKPVAPVSRYTRPPSDSLRGRAARLRLHGRTRIARSAVISWFAAPKTFAGSTARLISAVHSSAAGDMIRGRNLRRSLPTPW